MKTVTGRLTSASDRFYFFTTVDGEILPIVWEGSDPLPPYERLISMTVPDEPWDDDRYVVDNTGKYWDYAAQEVAGAPVPGTKRRVNIALYWQCYPGRDIERERKSAEKAALEIRRFYQKYSRGWWEVDCRPFLVTEYRGLPEPPDYGLMSISREVDLGEFDPDYHHVRSYHRHSSYCGLGNIHGTKGATYDGAGVCGVHTYCHELGHNFGLRHANEDGVEYEDVSDIMGKGPNVKGINGYHLLRLRLYDERERINVSDNTQLLVAPVELPWHALRENEYQHVLVYRDGGDTYHLTLRKDRGWPWSPRQDERMLWVHVRGESGKSNLVDRISPSFNPTRRLPNGVTVNYLEYSVDQECALIELSYPDSDTVPTPLSMPTGLAPRLAATEPRPEYTGLWYDKEYYGQGLDIQIKGDRVQAYLYSFNVKTNKYTTSKQCWYYIDGSTYDEELDLYVTTGGTFDDPTNHVLEKIGVCSLSFSDGNTAILRYNTSLHGREVMHLSKIDGSNDYGLWYDPNFVGSGFSIQVPASASSADMVCYWYTYANNGEQAWYMLQGERDNMTLYIVQDGHWCDYYPVSVLPIGSGQFVQTGENDATISISMSGNDYSYNLKRLF